MIKSEKICAIFSDEEVVSRNLEMVLPSGSTFTESVVRIVPVKRSKPYYNYFRLFLFWSSLLSQRIPYPPLERLLPGPKNREASNSHSRQQFLQPIRDVPTRENSSILQLPLQPIKHNPIESRFLRETLNLLAIKRLSSCVQRLDFRERCEIQL